ncbi:hypothetical protein A6A29_37925 [Streptomyces sp. TSRI0281]|nr:hypothetical protein A6A29_37925 [Streptomyces sp. TSRI0281]
MGSAAAGLAERVENGMVWLSRPTSPQLHLPFGGIDCFRFGWRRELSKFGMQKFEGRKLVRTLLADAGLRGSAG